MLLLVLLAVAGAAADAGAQQTTDSKPLAEKQQQKQQQQQAQAKPPAQQTAAPTPAAAAKPAAPAQAPHPPPTPRAAPSILDSYGGYDALYGDDLYYDYLDEYGYYGDDGDSYYEEYGYYADDDLFGYDDYYDEYYDYDAWDGVQDCTVGKDGKVSLSNGTAPCDVKLSGIDALADKLPGGVDGEYKLYGCHDGRPAYRRVNSPAGEGRVLWYSRGFGDWDVSKGDEPNETDILLYGGDVEHHVVPLFVSAWHLGGDLTSSSGGKADDVYVSAPGATATCADGRVFKPPKVNPAVAARGPILTDAEIEAKYRLIYERYGRRPEPNPAVNFSFVIMLVMAGLAIVVAIPYALTRKRAGPGGRGAYAPVATSFAAAIQQSKKKQSGHIN